MSNELVWNRFSMSTVFHVSLVNENNIFQKCVNITTNCSPLYPLQPSSFFSSLQLSSLQQLGDSSNYNFQHYICIICLNLLIGFLILFRVSSLRNLWDSLNVLDVIYVHLRSTNTSWTSNAQHLGLNQVEWYLSPDVVGDCAQMHVILLWDFVG